MWKKILVPHDFSTCAAHAVRLAADLAKTHGARLVVLHVSPLPPNVTLRNDGLSVETLAVTGDVATEIVSAAQAKGVDAIVMGTHGREGLSHLMLGSVAEKVIRRSEVPMVTVRWSRGQAEPTKEEREVEDELAG